MAIPDYNVEEKQLDHATHRSDKSDNGVFSHKEEVHEETAHEAAERGRAATDR
jgi:hypothetical protein